PPRISSPLVSNPPSAPAVPAAQLSISYAQQAPAAPMVDNFDAKVLADYGQPGAFYTAPIYAYRVFTRRSALRRDLATKRTDAERTKKRVEDALVALGERARALAKGGAAALELARAREDEARASAARDAADEEHKRADAKVKRIEIEMRNGAPRAS